MTTRIAGWELAGSDMRGGYWEGMGKQGGNPKAEYRRPKEIRMDGIVEMTKRGGRRKFETRGPRSERRPKTEPEPEEPKWPIVPCRGALRTAAPYLLENPKFEGRRTKEIRNSKSETNPNGWNCLKWQTGKATEIRKPLEIQNPRTEIRKKAAARNPNEQSRPEVGAPADDDLSRAEVPALQRWEPRRCIGAGDIFNSFL